MPSRHPYQRPEYSEFYPPRQRVFSRKKTTRQKIVKFFFILHTKPVSPASNSPAPISALNLAYTDNWTHLQHNASKITICIYLVLTFFLDHHILCLKLLMRICSMSSSGYFVAVKPKSLQLLLFLQVIIFFGKTNPLFAVSPLCCDWDFSPKVFPICCLKTNPHTHFPTLLVVVFMQRLRVYFFCQNAQEQAPIGSRLVFGRQTWPK